MTSYDQRSTSKNVSRELLDNTPVTSELIQPQHSTTLASEQATARNQLGRWISGTSGNPGGRPKKKWITEALEAECAANPQKLKQLSKSVLKVAHKNPSMFVAVRETLEGKLVEHVEHSGSLELAARVARARAAAAEMDGEDEK